MSNESDTAISIAYRKQLIVQHISVEVCKECKDAFVTNYQMSCKNNMPTVETCNLLKMFYT